MNKQTMKTMEEMCVIASQDQQVKALWIDGQD